MAKPISNRYESQLNTYQLNPVPGRQVDDNVYWQGPRGINNLTKLSQVPREFAPVIENLMLNEGFLQSRLGVMALGSEDNRVRAILSFTPANGGGILIRLRTDGADSWNGSTWLPIVDIVLTGNPTDRFTWTGWGDQLLFSNGAEKIISFNVVSGEVKILKESSPARHLTSFNGRVIASAVTDGTFYGYRVRWCAKLLEEDWHSETTTDGIGAGFEDLKASPGGRVDEVMGVFPISDESAVMVREGSIWMMLTTGDVSAPFRFSRMTGEIGCRARYAIAITPYGIVLPSMEDIFLVDQSGPKSIGQAVRRELIPSIADFPALSGTYDPRRQEYRLANGAEVWRYNFRDQGWTRDVYPYVIRHQHFVDYKSIGLTFDQLEGTLDELTGTFDELGIIDAEEGVHHVVEGSGVITREDSTVTNDNFTASPIEIRTGLLAAASALDKTEIIEAQLEYECDEAQRLFFEYSVDKGASWTQYSFKDIVQTTGPTVLSVRKTLISHNLQVRVRADTLGKLSLISLHLFVVAGARVNP